MPEDQLIGMIQKGSVSGDTQVYSSGGSPWTRADQIEVFMRHFPTYREPAPEVFSEPTPRVAPRESIMISGISGSHRSYSADEQSTMDDEINFDEADLRIAEQSQEEDDDGFPGMPAELRALVIGASGSTPSVSSHDDRTMMKSRESIKAPLAPQKVNKDQQMLIIALIVVMILIFAGLLLGVLLM